MKYGIMTFHNTPNYGAVLQAYALCRVLRENNVDCEIIDYYCEGIAEKELIFKKDANPIKTLIQFSTIWSHQKRRIAECQQFLKENRMVSGISYNKGNIQNALQEYDGFISGSDMIWELPFTYNDLNYFLAFANGSKQKFAYGSSVRSEWGPYHDTVIELLKQYHRIGVRESDVKAKLMENGIDCALVCDPTMLLPAEEWRKLIPQCPEKDYVLVYFPDERSMGAAERYAKRHQKQVLVLQDLKYQIGNYRAVKIHSPIEWMTYVSGADAVFSSSYHATLFSLYFNREFWVSGRWNKTTSVLQKLDLMSRHIEDDSDFDMRIDYSKVEPIIDGFRQTSLAFLCGMFCRQ